MTSLASCSISSQGSVRSSEGIEPKKYILLRDTVAKSKWPNTSSHRTRLRQKRTEQRVLKGSLWQECESDPFLTGVTAQHNSKLKSPLTSISPTNFKLTVESLEIEELTLTCASGFLSELPDELCRLLLAIPTSEERYLVHSDTDRMKSAKFINVGSDVMVFKRNVTPCRATVKWKGRLAGKQGVWFGVEIMDEGNKGSGDNDGSINNIRLFQCEKNNGMFVNIGQLTLVPPIRPRRKPKNKTTPSSPSQVSGIVTNGSHATTNSDQFQTDLVSQTESELSFGTDDITSADTAPLVDLQVNDRVIWPSDNGLEPAVVKWIGTIPDDDSLQGEILVGVEFDNPIGKGTGVYKNKRLFEAKKGHASLVPLDGLMRHDHDAASVDSMDTTGRLTTAGEVLRSLGIEDQDLNNNGHTSKASSSQAAHSPTTSDEMTARPPDRQTDITDSPSKSLHNHLSAKQSVSSHASESSSDNLAASPSSPYHQSKSQPITPHQPERTQSRPPDKKSSSLRQHRPANSHGRLHTHHYQPHHHSHHQHHTQRKPATKPKKMNGVMEKPSVPTTAELRDLFHNPGAAASNGPKKLEPLETDLDGEDIESIDGSSTSYTNTEPLPDYQIEDHRPELQHVTGIEDLTLNSKPTLSMHSEEEEKSHQLEDHKDSELDTLSLSEATASPNEEEHTALVAGGSIDPPILERLPSLPTSLADSGVPPLDLYTDAPEPPPEFTGDEEQTEEEELVSEERDMQGIQGSSFHSSYMEAILYILSISTDLLMQTDQSDYKDTNQFLLQNIAMPVQNEKMVDASTMARWRQKINDLSVGQLLQTGGQRDVQKFIRLVLEHICSHRPLYELNNDQSGYTMTLVSYKDARVGFPTVQKLLERTCIQQQVKFIQVPKYLILILPRWNLGNDKIFPNLHIDLTDVLEYATRICHMCGEQAIFECPECYETEASELSCAAFCEQCSNTIHKHSKRVNHMPVQLRCTDSPRSTGSTTTILRLVGVVALNQGHYTSYSEPFVEFNKRLTESQMLVDETEWYYFNSKDSMQDDEYVPKVTKVWGTSKWLSSDGYEHMAKEMDTTPDHIKTILQEGCVCFYTQS